MRSKGGKKRNGRARGGKKGRKTKGKKKEEGEMDGRKDTKEIHIYSLDINTYLVI